jgi:RimJ/RimL family protein N-acetyltransferase
MADFRLETARLILRDWREADWPEFFRLTNTPAVMRWLGPVMDAGKSAAQRARVESCAARHGHCFWVMERQADAPGSPVEGMFEIGWRMREDAWGRGYAKEAAQASLRAGFERFGAEEMVALTVEGNADSWGLMKRLGMRRREDLDFPDDRYPPELRDTIVYSITHAEWGA